MIAVSCPCGKYIQGSADLAGETVRCPKCRQLVTFPLPLPPAPPTPATAPEAPAAAAPAPGFWSADCLYWVLLVALLPLVLVLFQDRATLDVRKRLEATLKAHPELKPRLAELMESEKATVEDLFRILPGHRIDNLAWLPRESHYHLYFAAASVAVFFLVGVLMARRVVRPWQLLLIGGFTATFGIACLLVIHDITGQSMRVALDPRGTFLSRLLGYVFAVGLGEELCKAVPVMLYVRWGRCPTWRGALLWGMASGVGFGVAEGLLYSTRMYHGVAPAEFYLVRFASCVALHAVWSASVGITIFQARAVVSRVVGAVVFGGNFRWEEIAWPLLRVLGVAMALHGLYDALLTEQWIVPALLVALVSFGWLGWQVESAREQDAREAQAPVAPAPPPSNFALADKLDAIISAGP
jgi:RsiW-degrading membrane proteinase PrsW (M82 family)